MYLVHECSRVNKKPAPGAGTLAFFAPGGKRQKHDSASLVAFAKSLFRKQRQVEGGLSFASFSLAGKALFSRRKPQNEG